MKAGGLSKKAINRYVNGLGNIQCNEILKCAAMANHTYHVVWPGGLTYWWPCLAESILMCNGCVAILREEKCVAQSTVMLLSSWLSLK